MFSESIVIGLTAQGLSLYSPFWSPVIGRKPVNGISLLSFQSSSLFYKSNKLRWTSPMAPLLGHSIKLELGLSIKFS